MIRSDFELGQDGWEGGFADLFVGQEPDYELRAELAPLPGTLPARQGFLLSGENHSDDLWMYLTRRLTSGDGIVPGQEYEVRLSWSFASNAPSGCAGVGGAPGESVHVKVGASPRPAASVEDEGRWVFTLDQGVQSSAGLDSTLAGDVATGLPCPDDTWVLLERRLTHRRRVTATPEGELSVFVGSDSAFEGTTTLVFDAIEVTLTPIE